MRRSLALAIAAALALDGGVARADGLTDGEVARLQRGDLVTRPQVLERGARRCVGGVAYEIVDVGPAEISELLADVAAWRQMLPQAREARRVGERGEDTLVQITHGSALLRVAYTLQTRREADGSMRFWLARDAPHDIDDAWGFLRASPLPDGRTLLTWGILVDLGPGLIRDLFEARVQALALTVPERVRDAVWERQARGRAAER